ncbi:MAG: DNA double-strand break repair nuclease NurA [Thermaceae bacterium]
MWRLEPWDPEYALSEAWKGEGFPEVQPEESPWESVPRKAADGPRGVLPAEKQPFFLVDGKERVEALLSDGKKRVLLVGLAVGAVHRDEGGMRLEKVEVRRFAVGATEGFAFGEGLFYEPLSAESTDPKVLLERAQEERRRLEASLASALAQRGLVLLDGPLYAFDAPMGRVLGYAKTHKVRYLPDPYQDLLRRLRPGERTPIFRIPRGVLLAEKQPAYALAPRPEVRSWYVRLPFAEFFPPETGLLRVEVPASLSLEETRALADLSTVLFSSLASSPVRDPRAPQNLTPVGALEGILGRRLGHREVVRRRIIRGLGG